MVDRVHTPDGPGMVQEVERRQGRTWVSVAGRGFNGWYLSHEVTADIGDHNTVNLDDLPDRDEGTILPWDPDPRDTFHNQLNIQPTADLPENLDDTPSIRGLRNYDPTQVFGASEAWDDYAPYDHDDDTSDNHTDTLSQPKTIGDNSDIREKAGEAPEGNSHESAHYAWNPFKKKHDDGFDPNQHAAPDDHPYGDTEQEGHWSPGMQTYEPGEGLRPLSEDEFNERNSAYSLFGRTAHARHMHGGTTDVEDLPDETDQIPSSDKDVYQQVPSQWKSKQPGLSDYGEHYDEINDPQDGGDGPFDKSSSRTAFDWKHPLADLADRAGASEEHDLQDPESWYHPKGYDPNWRDNDAASSGPGPHDNSSDGAFERASATEYQVAATGDGYLVTSETGQPMSRYYSTETEAVHHARFAAYEDFLDRDPMARQAAWADVRKKALRLRKEGQVHVSYYEPKEIQAEVQGDNGLYDTSVSRKNAFGGGVTYYNCSCPWGQWAFKRQYTYIGRFCSHGLAAYHEMQSLDNKGVRSFNEDQNPFLNPAGSTDLGTFTQHIGSSKEEEELESEEPVVEGDFEKKSSINWAMLAGQTRTADFGDMDNIQGHSPELQQFFSWVEDNATPPPSRSGGMDRNQGPGRIPAPEDIDYPSLIKQYCTAHNSDPNQLMQDVGDYFDQAPYMVAMGKNGFDWARFADASMLSDNTDASADGGDMGAQQAIPAQVGPLMPVGQDPSHTVNPQDGDMQVFSDPAQQQPMTNNDNDAYGRGMDMNQGAPGGVADGVLNALTGDPLQGQEVPHQPDGDVAMMGVEVDHNPAAAMGDADQDGYSNPGGMDQQQGIDPAAMMGGMPSMGNPGDSDIAQMAQQFLAKTSAKNYSLREQEELMHEKGSARQFGELNTANSLYEQPQSFLDM